MTTPLFQINLSLCPTDCRHLSWTQGRQRTAACSAITNEWSSGIAEPHLSSRLWTHQQQRSKGSNAWAMTRTHLPENFCSSRPGCITFAGWSSDSLEHEQKCLTTWLLLLYQCNYTLNTIAEIVSIVPHASLASWQHSAKVLAKAELQTLTSGDVRNQSVWFMDDKRPVFTSCPGRPGVSS